MTDGGESTLKVTCPCCGATLSIDAGSGAVGEWKQAQDPRKGADLKDAEKLVFEATPPGGQLFVIQFIRGESGKFEKSVLSAPAQGLEASGAKNK